MPLEDLLEIRNKIFKKKYPNSDTEAKYGNEEKPATGIIVDNPLLEFALDRRFLAYGRNYLAYGRGGSGKTSLFYDFAKMFQAQGGVVIWIETERAADLQFAQKQGVDISRLIIEHPETLEEALNLIEIYVRNLPKAFNDDTPVLICLDSIDSSVTEYEIDQSHNLNDTKPGQHAKILSRYYREIENPLSSEKCVCLFLGQHREKIGGGTGSFGEEAPEALTGGNAVLHYNTCRWKMARKADIVVEEEATGAKRKVGSVHLMTAKRNKLGREGNTQQIEYYAYIDGGIDWYSPLVKFLGTNYTKLVTKSGGWSSWNIPDIKYLDAEGNEKTIDVEQNYREEELGLIIAKSIQAKEVIRTAFGIPPLPTATEIAEVEAERKVKRNKKKKALGSEDPKDKNIVET